ncbi:MAG: hypothetical protein OK439_06340 [Thaumarchaeota archaeon]|nr:hypothetical protein [Nitrososphaerota archaeon]
MSSAAICAALYAIVNIATSFIQTPFGIGEFRPGVVIPAFFAITAGPLPAALGAAIGSFIGDMLSLVPAGKSTFIWAIGGGGIGNFFGFLALGWVYEKMKSWRGFALGTTAGLFLGNLIAAIGVVFLGMLFLPLSAINPFPGMSNITAGGWVIGLLLFWFGTMFPFVIILVPPIVRLMKPYASSLSIGRQYPELEERNKKVVWGWSILVAILVLAGLAVALISGLSGVKTVVSVFGGSVNWEILFIISAIAVLVIGAFLPQISPRTKVSPEQKASA